MRIIDYLVNNGNCATYREARKLLQSRKLTLNGFRLDENSIVCDNPLTEPLPIQYNVEEKEDSATYGDYTVGLMEVSEPIPDWSDNQSEYVAVALRKVANKVATNPRFGTFLGVQGNLDFDLNEVRVSVYYDYS